MPRASWNFIGDLPLLIPPEAEQHAIAAFLDQETARIDELVARKLRLIELLGEKRSAITASALTHPSRRHHETVRVKHLLRFTTSGSRGWAEFYADEGDLFIQSGNLDRRLGLDLTNVQRIVPPQGAEVERTRIRRFDVLVCITGAYTGNVCVVQDDLPRAFVNQHLALLRPRQERVVPRFLAYYLSSSIGQGYFRATQYGGTKQGLGFEDIHSIPVVLPSLDQQRAIVAELDRQRRQIEELATFTRGGIAQLSEYRSALISAAVTGKIDVRKEPA
jgi:type I restriction enzyme S subunit